MFFCQFVLRFVEKNEKMDKQGFIVKCRQRISALPAVYERVILGIMLAVSLWMTYHLIILTINV